MKWLDISIVYPDGWMPRSATSSHNDLVSLSHAPADDRYVMAWTNFVAWKSLKRVKLSFSRLNESKEAIQGQMCRNQSLTSSSCARSSLANGVNLTFQVQLSKKGSLLAQKWVSFRIIHVEHLKPSSQQQLQSMNLGGSAKLKAQACSVASSAQLLCTAWAAAKPTRGCANLSVNFIANWYG